MLSWNMGGESLLLVTGYFIKRDTITVCYVDQWNQVLYLFGYRMHFSSKIIPNI